MSNVITPPAVDPTCGPPQPRPRLRSALTPVSFARCALWRLCGQRFDAGFRLRGGPVAFVRGGVASDFHSLYDSLVAQVYRPTRPVDPASIRHVVDVGGNVGHTTLFWLTTYANARVTVYEPHPAHVPLIERHLAANGFTGRATVRPVAAGSRPGHGFLTDDAWASTVTDRAAAGTIPISITDIHAELAGQSVDVMKLDCEGAEYDILADERFAVLRPRVVVMEVHERPGHPVGPPYCPQRLLDLGYETMAVRDLVWGYRKD